MNSKSIKLITLKKVFAFLFLFSLLLNPIVSQTSTCEIDSIHFTDYSVSFFNSGETFTDYKKMLESDMPTRNWIDYFENGKIIRRKHFRPTRTKLKGASFNYKNEKLEKIEFDGGINKSKIFYYDDSNRLKQVETISDFGNSEIFFRYEKDTIFAKERGDESKILLDSAYLKDNVFPYSGITFLDESFIFRRHLSDSYQYEFIYDECGNLKTIIRRVEPEGVINRLTSFEIFYKKD